MNSIKFCAILPFLCWQDCTTFMKKEKRRPRQRSQVHHKPNTDGSGLRQYGHKPISVYVARNYFRGGDSRAFEQSIMCSVSAFSADTSAKVGFLFYCNKEKKELFVLRRKSIIKIAKVATYYMLVQFLP